MYMKNPEKLDQLLKQALSSTQEPGSELNTRIINQAKECNVMKTAYRKKLSVVVLAAVLTLAMIITAFAAWQLLSPKQVAEHLQNQALALAFEDKSAIPINQSVVSGGY
jgi:cytochrome bd-type quinol oxidase subunit 1